jgi:hypothetical protein
MRRGARRMFVIDWKMSLALGRNGAVACGSVVNGQVFQPLMDADSH